MSSDPTDIGAIKWRCDTCHRIMETVVSEDGKFFVPICRGCAPKSGSRQGSRRCSEGQFIPHTSGERPIAYAPSLPGVVHANKERIQIVLQQFHALVDAITTRNVFGAAHDGTCIMCQDEPHSRTAYCACVCHPARELSREIKEREEQRIAKYEMREPYGPRKPKEEAAA